MPETTQLVEHYPRSSLTLQWARPEAFAIHQGCFSFQRSRSLCFTLRYCYSRNSELRCLGPFSGAKAERCPSRPGAREAPQAPGAAGPCAAPPHPAPLQVDKGGSSPAPCSPPARPPSRQLSTGSPLPLALEGCGEGERARLRTCARPAGADKRGAPGAGGGAAASPSSFSSLSLRLLPPCLPPGALCTFFSNHPRRQTLMGNLAPRWKNAGYERITGTPEHLPRHHRHPVWRHTWVRAGAPGSRRRGCTGGIARTMGASSSLPSASRGFPWCQKPAMRRGRRGSSQPLPLSCLASPQLCRRGGTRSPPSAIPCAEAPRGLKPGSLQESCVLDWGFPRAPGSRETSRERHARRLGRALVGGLEISFVCLFFSTLSLGRVRNLPKSWISVHRSQQRQQLLQGVSEGDRQEGTKDPWAVALAAGAARLQDHGQVPVRAPLPLRSRLPGQLPRPALPSLHAWRAPPPAVGDEPPVSLLLFLL